MDHQYWNTVSIECQILQKVVVFDIMLPGNKLSTLEKIKMHDSTRPEADMLRLVAQKHMGDNT